MVGIWFYDDDECDRISALLQRIANTFAAPSAASIGGGGGGQVGVGGSCWLDVLPSLFPGAGWREPL